MINTNGFQRLHNSEFVDMGFSYNSGESFNYGMLLSWQLSKNKLFYIKSGLSWTNMSFSTSTTYLSGNTGFFVNNNHEIKQVDLPILISYQKRVSNFEIGVDAGIVKSIWINSEISQNSQFQDTGSNPQFEQSLLSQSGFTEFSDKYSLFISPLIQWNFSKVSGLSLQPFYRIQMGDQSRLIYTTSSGSINQFGINLGYIFRL
jgi:hypothetical protein